MARLPDDEITRLKDEVSLLRLVESQGYQPKKQGKDYAICCPFHDEDESPSLIISPQKNLFHCFGCSAAGSVIDWVMQTRGVSFRFACEILQNDVGLVAANGSQTVRQNTTTKLPTSLAADADNRTALRRVIDYYHETLKQSPEALDYLNSRGLNDMALIDTFKLGFANRTLGYRLLDKNRKEGTALRGQLQRLGLVRVSGHEHFNGSIVIPVIDASDEITEVYGRKIGNRLRKGTPPHLYLPGPHRGVWNREGLGEEVILCESLIDAMTFWCAGYRNVTASYGTEGFTKDHLEAFEEQGTQRVLIAYDRDAAGEAAAQKLAKKLNNVGIDAYRIHFPKGMDANEYACQVQPAAKSLGVAIRSAIWLGKGQAKSASPIKTVPVVAEKTKTTKAAKVTKIMDEVPIAESIVEQPGEPSETSSNSLDKNLEALPATVMPPAPEMDIDAEVHDGEIHDGEIIMVLGDRRYRLRGLEKNGTLDVLKINVLVSSAALVGDGTAVHVDSFDLYQHRPRGLFIKQAAIELGVKDEVIKADLGKVLLKLEALQADMIKAAQTPEAVVLDDEETAAAMALLKSPDLLDRIQTDFSRCGVVGEDVNKLVGYLAVISRKLDAPLAITIQSTSAAGKSALMDAILALVPDEDCTKYSAMTGQSLFYMGETDLHKVLALVEEEGASTASYALKLLQSEGELTIASTGKDPVTGELKTQDYQVKGPVMIMLTTTAIDIDEELLNRCLVLTVDEGRKQTQAIHAIQRDKRTLGGLLAKADKQSIVALHQNAQRLLQPLAVVNPYAQHLSFIDDRTRTRRDHDKYLTLIDSIALLHQHQRPIKTIDHHGQSIRYVEVTIEDIKTANRLAHEILGRTLDELPPQTRALLRLIKGQVTRDCERLAMSQRDYRFSRRSIREVTGWSDGQLKIHCRRLAELEYLLVHRGGRGQRIEYELQYDGSDEDQPHLMGLIDPEKLQYDPEKLAYDDQKIGQKMQKTEQKPQKIAPSQGQDRPKIGPSQGRQNGLKANNHKASSELGDEIAKKALLGGKKSNSSCRNDRPLANAH